MQYEQGLSRIKLNLRDHKKEPGAYDRISNNDQWHPSDCTLQPTGNRWRFFAPPVPSDCASTAEREADTGSIGCTAGMRENHAGILFGKAVRRAARPCADPSNRDGWLSQKAGIFEKPFCTGGQPASFHGGDQRGPRHI